MATTALAPLLAAAGAAGRAAVLDGGLGQLLADESPGLAAPDGLWAAGVAVRSPAAVRAAHRRFLDAGADIITTATYQASAEGYIAAGLAPDERGAEALLAAALAIAVDARADFAAAGAGRRPLVAASLGSIGATLGNCSEYTGRYGHGVAAADIRAFHLRRFRMLARCLEQPRLRGQIDLVAVETIPSLAEAAAVVSALDELHRSGARLPPAWVSLTAAAEDRVPTGEPVEDVVRVAAGSPHVCAVGVNCVPLGIAAGLLARVRRATALPVVCCPNGQAWAGSAGGWRDEAARTPPGAFAAAEWVAGGAAVVGGCCRAGPEHIGALARAVRGAG